MFRASYCFNAPGIKKIIYRVIMINRTVAQFMANLLILSYQKIKQFWIIIFNNNVLYPVFTYVRSESKCSIVLGMNGAALREAAYLIKGDI